MGEMRAVQAMLHGLQLDRALLDAQVGMQLGQLHDITPQPGQGCPPCLMLLALPISMRGRGLLIINTPAIPSIRGLLPLLLLPLGAWPPAASWRWVTLLARRTALGAARWQDRAAFNRCTAELSCTTAWKKV